jgi:hypothetical protein
MRIAFGIGSAVALSAAALISSGTAWAVAPNVVGQKYGDAVGALGDAGYRPIVSTTVGDRLQRPDCLVVNQVSRTVAPPPNSSGSATNEVLLSLNCEHALASAGAPGNSAGSPVGSQASVASSIASMSAEASASQAAEQQLAEDNQNQEGHHH